MIPTIFRSLLSLEFVKPSAKEGGQIKIAPIGAFFPGESKPLSTVLSSKIWLNNGYIEAGPDLANTSVDSGLPEQLIECRLKSQLSDGQFSVPVGSNVLPELRNQAKPAKVDPFSW